MTAHMAKIVIIHSGRQTTQC